MQNELVHLVFALIILVFGGGLEELAPKVLGVGSPVLLAATLFFATRRARSEAVLFAVAAGAFEDALSGLPVATGIAYFTLVALVARIPVLQIPTGILSYPAYQIWLWLWLPTLNGSIFNRLLLSVPIGLFTVFLTGLSLVWLERKAALDEK